MASKRAPSRWESHMEKFSRIFRQLFSCSTKDSFAIFHPIYSCLNVEHKISLLPSTIEACEEGRTGNRWQFGTTWKRRSVNSFALIRFKLMKVKSCQSATTHFTMRVDELDPQGLVSPSSGWNVGKGRGKALNDVVKNIFSCANV